MQRTYTPGGTDCTVEAAKYMWLKKHLLQRGVSKAALEGLYDVQQLYNLALSQGILTTKPLKVADGHAGLPLAVEAFESVRSTKALDRVDRVEEHFEDLKEVFKPPLEPESVAVVTKPRNDIPTPTDGGKDGVQIHFVSDLHLNGLRRSYRVHQEEAVRVIPDNKAYLKCLSDQDAEGCGEWALPPAGDADYLAVLGDACESRDILDEEEKPSIYKAFLRDNIGRYKKTLLITGNHEHWGKYAREKVRARMAQMVAELNLEFGRDAVEFMDQRTLDLEDGLIRVIATPLWSEVRESSKATVEAHVSDYGRIPGDVTSEVTTSWHFEELEWLQREIKRCEKDGKKAVVLTHHTPTRGIPNRAHVAPEPFCFSDSAVTDAFSTSLEYMIQPPIVAWLFGHTHHSSALTYEWSNDNLRSLEPASKGSIHPAACKLKKKIDTTRQILLASNQMGYPFKGEHSKKGGEGSCYNPFMTLYVSLERDVASLGPSVR